MDSVDVDDADGVVSNDSKPLVDRLEIKERVEIELVVDGVCRPPRAMDDGDGVLEPATPLIEAVNNVSRCFLAFFTWSSAVFGWDCVGDARMELKIVGEWADQPIQGS